MHGCLHEHTRAALRRSQQLGDVIQDRVRLVLLVLVVAVGGVMLSLPPAASGDDYLLQAGGALTVGGPGEFLGKENDFLAIHASGVERTLCVTLEGKLGTTRATFGPMAFNFDVVKEETRAVCRDEVSTIDLLCDGGDCGAHWRVDTVP